MESKRFNSRLKISGVTKKEYLDKSTGELLGKHDMLDWTVRVDSSSFLFLYKRLLSELKVIGESDLKVFLALCFSVGFNDSKIIINKDFINGIMESLGYTEGTVRNCVSSLSKGNLLIKSNKSRGVYSINPEFAWIGDRASRPKALKILLMEELEMDEGVIDFSNGKFDDVELD
jgi:hypothetical protein